MFGFSIQKLIFTVAIILIVWYGFKFLGRIDKQRKARLKAERRQTAAKPQPKDNTEDMTACPTCGTYVSLADARSCGRDDCPYPG